ncbi:MAG: hypothetical protein GY862_04645 [Gammaproteobacteria bacterium]|nr:hypothetical protein [Gammaproteobacteria bacterium]
MKKTNSILLIGGPATGKTHYGVQLYGRIMKGEEQLKLHRTPDTIKPFEEALGKLNQGIPANHTATDIYHEITLPLEFSEGKRVDLVWPDYGGEQIQQMLESRQVNPDWRRRVAEAQGWLLFIRLDRIRDYKDIVSSPIEELVPMPQHKPDEDPGWSDQARFIELLQLLLFTKGTDILKRVEKPVLGVLLSCWDLMAEEIAENTRPAELLQERMPLLHAFLNAIWGRNAYFELGLSSLGRTLKKEQPDKDYIERGPENEGYVILPDGAKSPDLTQPVAELMQRMQ